MSVKAGGPRRTTIPRHADPGAGATHRKLSTVLNSLRNAGLEAERFATASSGSDVPDVAVQAPLIASLLLDVRDCERERGGSTAPGARR